MPQSVHSCGSTSSNHHHHHHGHRHVHVVLLSRETLVVPVENKNTKLQDVFSRACDHVDLREREFFGLAQLKENEFQFLQRDIKISKLTSKIWKSKDSSLDEPLQTFYLRIQYYVENISLLKEKTTRLQYYLQMKDNLLTYGQSVAEEKCFLLASYALQADHGDHVAGSHGNSYFDPREYFPASVVMRRGLDYITTHLPAMHRSMAGMPPPQARVNYILELSTPPIAHNFHFYKTRKRKYDTAAVAWVAICPTGLGTYEETDGFRYPVTVFRWPDIGRLHFEKKKFEIISEGVAGPKYTFYFDCTEWAEYIVDLCRQVHRFHLTLQPRLAELQRCHAQDPRFREKYVHSENSECTLYDRHRSPTRVGQDDRVLGTVREPLVEPGSTSSAVWSKNSSLGSEGQEKQEIFITNPPLRISSNGLLLEIPNRLQTFDEYDPKKRQLQETGGVPQRQFAYASGGNGNGRGETEYSIGNIPAAFASYLVSASSSESVSFVPYVKADGFFRRENLQLAAGSATHSQVPSDLTAPSQRGSSTNSSAGSGQLPLSLPASNDVYDAALLRQSLPNGVHFNDYLRNLWSGQGVTSDSISTPRKSGSDRLQANQTRLAEPVQRSTSLRQPLFDWGGSRAGSVVLSQGDGLKMQNGLWVMRSNSDKTPNSSKLTLLPELLGPRAVAREDPREAWASSVAFALPSGIVTATHCDSSISQNSSLFSVTSNQMTSLPCNSLTAVSRSESAKSQTGLSLHSDVYHREEGYTIATKREYGQFASGLTQPIIPVEAQIQKLVFGPTMTAVSTPVRPATEKPVGNLPTVSYQFPCTYIPDSFPVSVIRPALRSGAYIVSVPRQDTAVVTSASDILYQSNGSTCPCRSGNRSFPQPSSDHLSGQTIVRRQTVADESADSHYHERPCPPPYGAFHSTISNVRFPNPVQAQRMVSTQLSHVTVAKPFPADALAKQLLEKSPTGLDPVTPSAVGKRELSSWLMVNGNKVSGQQKQTGNELVQARGFMNDTNQATHGSTYQDQSTTGNHQVKKLAEVVLHELECTQSHLQQMKRNKKSEVTRHVSDRHPGHHDPQCPRHGISSDIRERLRGLGSSFPPMLNALLTDKSLHTSCTCLDSHGDNKRVAAARSSDSLNLPGLSVQPKVRNVGERKLRYFPDLSLEGDGDATMIINGTMNLNGTYLFEEVDEDSGRCELLSSAVPEMRPENGVWLMHHSSDSSQRPQRTAQPGHSQSNSDSATRDFVSGDR